MIVLLVEEGSAAGLRRSLESDVDDSSNGVRRLLEICSQYGLKIRAVTDGRSRSQLDRYFNIEAADRSTAEKAILHLSSLDSVEAAYWKAAAEPS